MSKRKWLNVDVEIKAINEDGQNYITGYASVFGNIDSYDDIVSKGAFTKTLSERVPVGLVKFLDSHNSWESRAVLGTVTEAYEDDRGLWFKAHISSVQSAQDILTKVKEGHLNRLSIGYDTVKTTFDQRSGIRYLTEVKLYEVSVVTFAANEEATILSAKSIGEINQLRSEIKKLRDEFETKLNPETAVKEIDTVKGQTDEPKPDEPGNISLAEMEFAQAKSNLSLIEMELKRVRI